MQRWFVCGACWQAVCRYGAILYEGLGYPSKAVEPIPKDIEELVCKKMYTYTFTYKCACFLQKKNLDSVMMFVRCKP